MSTLDAAQLEIRRARNRVDKSAATLLRAKRLEAELMAKRHAAHEELQLWLWTAAARVAETIRAGKRVELPDDDGGRRANAERLDFQANFFFRVRVRLRAEFIDATTALDAINTTKENVA